jgi:hypothetical protein
MMMIGFGIALLPNQKADTSRHGQDRHKDTESTKTDAEDSHQTDDDEVNGKEAKTEVAGDIHDGE